MSVPMNFSVLVKSSGPGELLSNAELLGPGELLSTAELLSTDDLLGAN